jgi:hypothetical protein
MSRSIVRIASVAAVAAAFVVPGSAEAQGKWSVPPGHMPPAGQCRIWVDGVPPGRQPAPMDCETAVRMKPRNARVVYGERTILVDGKKPKKSKGRKNDRYDDRYEGRDDDRRDRDDDRWERDSRWPSDDCTDRNRDGRCDAVASRSLPGMIGIVLGGSPRTSEQERWLGDRGVRARIVDADRDRVAERVSWYDSAGQLVQVWLDANRDGRADAVRLYERGRLVREVR